MAEMMPQPDIGAGLQRGAAVLSACIGPTLGPSPRAVLSCDTANGGSPELLENGGVIARRIIELPGAADNVGAMLLRQLLVGLEESVGDGTATAAVIYESLLRSCTRLAEAGHDRVNLRGVLDGSARRIDGLLESWTTPISDRATLEAVTNAAAGELGIGSMLAEVFDLVGSTGRLEIRVGNRSEPSMRFVSGSYWDWSLLASTIGPGAERIDGSAALVVLTDLDLDDAQDLVRFFELIRDVDTPVFVTAASVSDRCASILYAQQGRPAVAVARLPRSDRQVSDLMDVALLTGATPLLGVAGRRLGGLRHDEIGRARHAWADRQHFGIIGGYGDRLQLRVRLSEMRSAYAVEDDPVRRREVLRRLGRLSPGSAVLSVGARTARDSDTRKETALRASATIRSALDGGIVPGGGAVLLAIADTLRGDLDGPVEATSRGVTSALAGALEQPLKVLAANAGHDPERAAHMLRSVESGHVFDVSTGTVRRAADAAVWDATAVVRAAVRGAITTVAQAISVEAVVRSSRFERKAGS